MYEPLLREQLITAQHRLKTALADLANLWPRDPSIPSPDFYQLRREIEKILPIIEKVS